jgi:hypothetical protein
MEQICIGFVYTEMNRLARASVTSVGGLTVADTRTAIEGALGPLFPYAEVLAEAIRMLQPASAGVVQLLRGAKMSIASEEALKACVGGVIAFPTFTSFSERGKAARRFPQDPLGRDEVKVFFRLDCQGRHRVGGLAAEEGRGEEGVLLPPFVPLALEAVVNADGRTMFCLSDLAITPRTELGVSYQVEGGATGFAFVPATATVAEALWAIGEDAGEVESIWLGDARLDRGVFACFVHQAGTFIVKRNGPALKPAACAEAA